MAPPTKHPTDVILDAARTIVLNDGPRAASVSAIAKASGAPVGTLYHRFGNRDGLLTAAWLRALERFQTLAMSNVAVHQDPVARAAAIVASSVEFGRHHPDDARLLLVVRRDDLLDADPGEDLHARLDAMNAPLVAELHEIARRVYGNSDARAVDAVTRAVVDLPYAAIRRYAGVELPHWLADDLIASVQMLLRSSPDR
ncbi:MAG: TetR/AcrR family transcriptional regulator [Mycobacteriaceae bacterium]|nr:TetR/AcrR family transcriptional regulator [Mycobacteriaceae bacterium]